VAGAKPSAFHLKRAREDHDGSRGGAQTSGHSHVDLQGGHDNVAKKAADGLWVAIR
jgi:hypothetical protein